jgi:hypothetical protein
MEETYYNAALKERAHALLLEAVEVVKAEERETWINRDKKKRPSQGLPTSGNKGKSESRGVVLSPQNGGCLP